MAYAFYYPIDGEKGRKRRVALRLLLMNTRYDTEIDHVLRIAFGRTVPTWPIPLGVGRADRYRAFALDDPDLPPHVMLVRYPLEAMPRAFRAFSVMQALHEIRFPVPEVYYLGWARASREVLMLSEHVDAHGEEGQTHAFFARVGPHFAQTLAQLHQLEWEELPDLATLPFRYALDALAAHVREFGTSEMDTILDWLLPQVKNIQELPHTVLHGDYTLGNVLGDRVHIVAVLGWENALLADPRFDIGYTSAVLGAYGVALSDQFLASYEVVSGPIPDRVFWDVFSALRLLMRLTNLFDSTPLEQREVVKAQAIPVWNGLLNFVAHRAHLTTL